MGAIAPVDFWERPWERPNCTHRFLGKTIDCTHRLKILKLPLIKGNTVCLSTFKIQKQSMFISSSAAALEGCNGCNCTHRFLGKTLGKTKLHPSIFGKDHRLHPSIENPKAAADSEHSWTKLGILRIDMLGFVNFLKIRCISS